MSTVTTTWHPAGTGFPVPPPPPIAPGGQPLAEFSDRLLAYLIDGAIYLAVLSVPLLVGFVGLVRWMAHLSDGEQQRITEGKMPLGVLAALSLFVAVYMALQLIVTFLYAGLYQARRNGQTVGKRVMRIRVVRLDGGPFDLATATIRWLFQSVAGLVPYYSTLDGLWQLWDKPYRQCLHDKGADTVVIKVDG